MIAEKFIVIALETKEVSPLLGSNKKTLGNYIVDIFKQRCLELARVRVLEPNRIT